MAILCLPSGTAAVLVYLQPILIGFLAWMILGEKLSAAKVLGLFLGFSGIVAVSSGSFSGAIAPLGVVFGVSSALFWALGTVYFKKFQNRVSTMWSVALQFLVGGIVLTAFSPAVDSWSEVSWSEGLFLSIAYSSFVGIALAWMIWFSLVQAGEASRVAAYVFFVPLVSIVFGAIFLDEALRFTLLIGAVLIVSGIYLVNRSPSGEKL